MFGSMGQTSVKDLGNGGTIDGDLVISGDLTVSGGGSLSFDEIIEGTQVIDVTSTEALLVRKNGDGGDILTVDTTNSKVIATELDISGNIDVDGTSNLDDVDIDGDVDISGSITNATWTGDVIASAYLDSDTAHLSGTQTFSGSKTFSANTIISSTNQLQFGDDGTYIHQSADGVLDLVSDTEIEINATTIDVNGSMEVSGTLTASDDLVVSDELRPYEIRADGTSGVRLANSQGGIVGYLGLRSSGNYGSGLKLEDDIGSVIFGSDSDYSAKYDSGSDALEIIEGITSASETVLFSLSSSTTEVNTATTNFNGTAINFESSSADSPIITIKNTNAGDGSPRLYFNHASASPADNDELGQIRWYGLNDAGTPVSDVYARIKVNQTDVSSGSEAGKMGFQLMKAGTETDILTLDADSRISLSNNDAGSQNTIFGKSAGNVIESGGNENVLVGHEAGIAITTGDRNVSIGYQALNKCTTKLGNISIGWRAHYDSLTTNENVAIGSQSGEHQTSGNQNVFVGGWSGQELTTADKCVALGYNAMAGTSSTPPTGDNNVGVGWYSLARIQSGGGNVAMGSNTLEDLTTGQQNLALGHFAMAQTVGASDCTALGYYAMGAGNVTASGTTAVGASACAEKIGGGTSTAVGFEAMRADLYGEHNTAVGYQALEDNTIGDGNTAVGARALQTFVGDNNAGKTNTTGGENTFMGWNAGAVLSTGDNNTIIGSQANASASGATNQTAIGQGCTAVGDNSVTLGNASVTAVYASSDSGAVVHCAGIGDGTDTLVAIDTSNNVKINGAGVQDTGNPGWTFIAGNSNQGSILEHACGDAGETIATFRTTSGVAGSIATSGTSTTFATSSDYRLKENEVAISDGLTRLNQLKPYRFNWKHDKDTTVDGFFAHEVSEIVPEAIVGLKDAVNDKGEIDPQGIDQSKIVPLLVKAVQELSAKVTELENK
jgi:hypothetical protein